MGTKRTWGIAAALLAASVAGSAARAQDAKPQPVLEKLIQETLEQKKRDQEQAQKNGAKQDAETPEQLLARAKLLADSEHDYEKALALAQTVELDVKNPSELRAQALVVASRCLNQLGRTDEARAHLKRAARLNGPAADEAKRLLDGGQNDQQLELRIAKAIEELFTNATPESLAPLKLETNQTASDLIWLGAPAVPRLARILGDVDHLAAVTGAAYLLGCIGNAEAATAIRDALQRRDPLYRRAVLRGFETILPDPTHVDFWASPVRDAATSLLKDRDARVRESMLNDHPTLMTAGEVLEMTRDPDDGVRIAAWKAMRGLSGGAPPAQPDAIVAALRRCLKEDHDPVRVAAAEVLGLGSVKRNTDGRELAFESMLDPVLTGPEVTNLPGWMNSFGSNEAQQTMLQRPLPIDVLVRVAERFDRDSGSGAPPTPRAARYSIQVLSQWIGASANAQSGETDHRGWPASDRAKAWSLVRLGYGADLGGWISDNATSEDVPTIVDFSIEAGDFATLVNVVHVRNQSLTEAQRQTIAGSIVRVVEAERVGFDRADKGRVNRLSSWCTSLAILGDDAGDEELLRVATDRVFPDAWIASKLLQRDFPLVALRHLAALVTLPAAIDNSNVNQSRNAALGRLAAAHSTELPKILATCYARGLGPSEVKVSGRFTVRPVGFQWLVTCDFGPDAAVASSLDEKRRASSAARQNKKFDLAASWEPSYPEADVRAAFEACANGGGSERFWNDVKLAIDLLPEDGPYDPIATAVLELAVRCVPSAPLVKDSREIHPIVGSLLSRRAPGWEELAMTGILDSRWRDAILKSLPEVTPGLLDRLAGVHDLNGHSMRRAIVGRLETEKNPAIRARAPEFLKDESLSVRQAAISATLAIMPERALDLILPLAKDPSSSVRAWLCTCLGSVFDRRAIPVLVDLLEDPDNDVRVAAKTSLGSLQYTFEQKEKWKRVLEGGGLETASAAEALVKQAAVGQPKATRLVAIESLGTLGVAETLPVLIQFMGDGDAEIAAAAKEAVARINRQSKAGKDAKPPSDH